MKSFIGNLFRRYLKWRKSITPLPIFERNTLKVTYIWSNQWLFAFLPFPCHIAHWLLMHLLNLLDMLFLSYFFPNSLAIPLAFIFSFPTTSTSKYGHLFPNIFVFSLSPPLRSFSPPLLPPMLHCWSGLSLSFQILPLSISFGSHIFHYFLNEYWRQCFEHNLIWERRLQ